MTIKLACAPIAWTNDDLPELGGELTFEQCISEMALAGYQGTEIGNKYPRDPEILRSYLEPRNLEVASAWFSAFLTTKPFEETEKAFIKHRDFLHAMPTFHQASYPSIIVLGITFRSKRTGLSLDLLSSRACLNSSSVLQL